MTAYKSMKKIAAFVIVASILIILLQNVNARVDAEFVIKDMNGREIYMVTPNGKVIYGNVVVGQKIIFDASASNSMYKIDRYYWDFNGDGKYDRITPSPITVYAYNKPGIYKAKLMAVATSAPPHGDGDVVVHEIAVVSHLQSPIAKFSIKLLRYNSSSAIFLFNASASYDKDGYIKAYYWDFNGDGKYDRITARPYCEWKFRRNGYYVITLETIDYDLKTNETKRVLEVNELNNSINGTEGEIKIINKGEVATALLNNNHLFLINKSRYVIKAMLNNGLNEIYISSHETNKKILFYGKNPPTIIITNNKIYLQNEKGKSPGYALIPLLISLVFALVIKKKRKRYGS